MPFALSRAVSTICWAACPAASYGLSALCLSWSRSATAASSCPSNWPMRVCCRSLTPNCWARLRLYPCIWFQ